MHKTPLRALTQLQLEIALKLEWVSARISPGAVAHWFSRFPRPVARMETRTGDAVAEGHRVAETPLAAFQSTKLDWSTS
jgi:hypothetical protein